MAKVKFFAVDLKSTFTAITNKDEFALYWILETQELYKGNLLFAVGKEATVASAGLMSAEDKKKLDTLAGITGAVHFLGKSETDPLSGVVTINGEVIEAKAGDIVLYNSKEYICDMNGNFVELGDESIYLTEEKANELYVTKEDAKAEHEALQAQLDLIDIKDIAWGKNNANGTKFEVISAVKGFLTSEAQNDLRVYIPKGSEYNLQNVGAGGLANQFYMTVRAWSPVAEVTACRKGEVNRYNEHFTDMESIKFDAESGRPYVDFWLAIAYTDDNGVTWNEYADLSVGTKYIGYNWLVEWYNGEELVASGSKKITLVNNYDMLYNAKDWYIPAMEADISANKSGLKALEDKVGEVENAVVWESIK